jgi:Fe2+ or Zn2+ uptake regulation protein
MGRRKADRTEEQIFVCLVLKERGIALPTTRLQWYARWLKMGWTNAQVYRILRELEAMGWVRRYKEGGEDYWQLL